MNYQDDLLEPDAPCRIYYRKLWSWFVGGVLIGGVGAVIGGLSGKRDSVINTVKNEICVMFYVQNIDNQLYFSIASVWEMYIKIQLGKLSLKDLWQKC